jgi:electron transfer flavoprotein alpha subunit
MKDILVVAEQTLGQLKSTTLSGIAFAKQASVLSGGKFAVLVIGKGAQTAAEAVRAFGADKVLVCDDDALADYVAERFAPTVASAAQGFGLLCATASSYGKDLMPRVAARLDAGFAGDCSAVSAQGDKLVFKRPMFAGNAFGHVQLTTPVQVVTLRQSEFAAAEASGGESPLENIAFTPPGNAAARVDFVSLDQVKSERPELAEAKVVIAGGRALKEKFFELLDPLATELGAAIGASRAACDAGYAPGDYQVGQTGKIVAPDLYIAIGISGAIQHVAGMKGSKVIVAINKDAEAPIFQIADYGLVADLFTAIPELVAALKARH